MCREASCDGTGSSPSSTAAASSGVSSTTSARCGTRAQHLGDDPRPVGLHQRRLQRRHRVDQRGQQRRAGARRRPGRGPAVDGEQVDPVAGPVGQRGQQQRGVHRGVQPRLVADPGAPRCARCRAPAARGGRAPGRQVRTTTCWRRAVARQSIERTSSPSTYSRSESNSVPCPRAAPPSAPSSSRSRASLLGQVPARGERRQHPHPAGQPASDAAGRPGPAARRPHGDLPPRAGRRAGSGVSRRRSAAAARPAGRSSAVPVAARRPADGCQASRSSAAHPARGPVWCTSQLRPAPARRAARWRARSAVSTSEPRRRPASTQVEHDQQQPDRRAAQHA